MRRFLAHGRMEAALRAVLRGEHHTGAKRWRRDSDTLRGDMGDRGERDRRPPPAPRKRRRGAAARASPRKSPIRTSRQVVKMGRLMVGLSQRAAAHGLTNHGCLTDSKFKEFRCKCRKQCADTCFAFLVGSCREPSCKRPNEVPAAFEAIKRKFR